MPIDVTCSGCGQKLKARDTLAGKTVGCPKCATKLTIPVSEDGAAAFLLQEDQIPPPVRRESAPYSSKEIPSPEPEASPPRTRENRSRSMDAIKKKAVANAIVSNETPFWLRQLHWLLILTLIPLGISILQGKSDSFGDRLETTLEKATSEQAKRVVGVLNGLEKDPKGFETLFTIFPDNKLSGALLARNSQMHWVFALGSIALFLGFFILLSLGGSANPIYLLCVGLITATAGIVLLLGFQMIANWTQGVWVRGGSILVVFFYIIKLIGMSYQMALDPEYGLVSSFFGFTFGVGLCEELVKILPVFVKYQDDKDQTWHGAFLWGMASGAGFGISEGIMYSANYYNGISGWDIYVVRFVSCVALHALWTGSAAIMLHQKKHLFYNLENWYDYIAPFFVVVGVPMVLHGLYDTLLKKDMEAGALVVAVLSFVFLAIQNVFLHGEDTKEATRDMLKEYKNRRKQMT